MEVGNYFESFLLSNCGNGYGFLLNVVFVSLTNGIFRGVRKKPLEPHFFIRSLYHFPCYNSAWKILLFFKRQKSQKKKHTHTHKQTYTLFYKHSVFLGQSQFAYDFSNSSLKTLKIIESAVTVMA